MKNIIKTINKKFISTILIGLTLMSPLAGTAYAAPKHGTSPYRQVQHLSKGHISRPPAPRHPQPQPIRHDVHYINHTPQRHEYRDRHRDDVGILIGGLILGTIIGAAIADSNSSDY